jgi:hypothetical protein
MTLGQVIAGGSLGLVSLLFLGGRVPRPLVEILIFRGNT